MISLFVDFKWDKAGKIKHCSNKKSLPRYLARCTSLVIRERCFVYNLYL